MTVEEGEVDPDIFSGGRVPIGGDNRDSDGSGSGERGGAGVGSSQGEHVEGVGGEETRIRNSGGTQCDC